MIAGLVWQHENVRKDSGLRDNWHASEGLKITVDRRPANVRLLFLDAGLQQGNVCWMTLMATWPPGMSVGHNSRRNECAFQIQEPRPTATTAIGGQDIGNGASGMPNNARIPAGQMTSPPNPRRNQQQGMEIIEFTVDWNGKVITAYAMEPSTWGSLLNQEPVSNFCLWRFPHGDVMTLQRPIVFQLRQTRNLRFHQRIVPEIDRTAGARPPRHQRIFTGRPPKFP